VTMRRNFALESAELAAGFVLTCQSTPTTAKVIVDFDD
jgi:ring-1,2-phenylacetyl-CoA epoxidase subunit PaaE